MFRSILCICVAGLLITMVGCVSSQSQLMEERVRRTVTSSGYKGPFSFDSQKALNYYRKTEYNLCLVEEVDHKRSRDGTWYIERCKIFIGPNPGTFYYINFSSPYPQQYDVNKGDFIGFSGKPEVTRSGEFAMVEYHSGKLLENISSQSVKYKVDGIGRLSTPTERTSHVTGMVMAVEIGENQNPEPDNPDNFQINNLVMKCADGNLYFVSLSTLYGKYPNQKAFGEGDIITVSREFYRKGVPYLIASW